MSDDLIVSLPDEFRCVRLDRIESSETELPHQACLLMLPLTAEGQIDTGVAEQHYGACRVLRWRVGEPYEEGYLTRSRDGSWVVRREIDAFDGPTTFKFDRYRFVTGESLMLIDNEGMSAFRVSSIRRI